MMTGAQLMVVLIVLIAVVGSVIRKKDRHGRGSDTAMAAENARLHDEMRQLKERLQVLERVITDSHGSVGLDREIERLRDR